LGGVKQDCCAVSAAASHEANHSAFAKAPIFLPNYLHTHPNSLPSYGDESACSQRREALIRERERDQAHHRSRRFNVHSAGRA